MTGKVVPISSRSGLFGLCPFCRRLDGHAVIGRDHWGVCHRHCARWLIAAEPGAAVHAIATGALLNATHIDDDDLVLGSARAADYRVVEAWPPADDDPEPPPPPGAA